MLCVCITDRDNSSITPVENSVKPDDGDVETDLTQVILGMKSGVDFCLQVLFSSSFHIL